MKKRYLRKLGDSQLWPYDDVLATRQDMVEVWAEGVDDTRALAQSMTDDEPLSLGNVQAGVQSASGVASADGEFGAGIKLLPGEPTVIPEKGAAGAEAQADEGAPTKREPLSTVDPTSLTDKDALKVELAKYEIVPARNASVSKLQTMLAEAQADEVEEMLAEQGEQGQ